MSIIDKLNEVFSGHVDNAERGYLGMSTIGSSCARKLQYSMYLVKPVARISKRIERLFNDGHSFEHKLCKLLEDAGLPVTGRQIRLRCENEMWFGHIDGTILFDGIEYLAEMKTHNDKNFKNVVKVGMRKGKPEHYDQMTLYMGYGGWTKGIYFAYNKNDSDIYFEIVEFDPVHFEKLKRKMVDVIASDVLLPRIGNNSPTWYECKFCNVSDVCFNKVEVYPSCRSCKHVDLSNGNKWSCMLHGADDIPFPSQLEGCDSYEIKRMFSDPA